jgi:hypothetical protein
VPSGERADKGKKKMRYVDTTLFARPFLSFRANALFRGRNKAMKRFMRKKKQNVIDPSLMAAKQKIAAQKKSEEEKVKRQERQVTGALARFG